MIIMARLKNIPANRIIAGSKELAKILSKTEQTINRWKNQGRLNYLQVGREYFYDSENIFDTSYLARQSKRIRDI